MERLDFQWNAGSVRRSWSDGCEGLMDILKQENEHRGSAVRAETFELQVSKFPPNVNVLVPIWPFRSIGGT